MKGKTTWLSAILACALPLSAAAIDLKPMQAHTVYLDQQTAVIYYTGVNGEYEVVTTVATNDGSGVPTRFVAKLVAGERQTLSFADPARTIIEMIGSENLVSIYYRAAPQQHISVLE